MQDLISQQLGNYRLIELLGKGGFARVYLGEHIFLGSQAKAAIKVLNETKLSDEDRQSFTVEARTIRKLNHPHIIKVLEFGIEVSRYEDASIPYLVMDYAPAGSLRKRHPRNTVVPLQQIVSYVNQVADGLQYAHDQGIVHRDVKPENMLVMGPDEIVLSDFGIAITSHDSKNYVLKDGTVQGTLAYLAPERFLGNTRRASDQYSLGIVVYEWLTGAPPFKDAHEQIVFMHAHTPPPPLYGVYPHISQEIEKVVMKALDKEPELRYPTVKDFAQALNLAAQGAIKPQVQEIYQQSHSEPPAQPVSLESSEEHTLLASPPDYVEKATADSDERTLLAGSLDQSRQPQQVDTGDHAQPETNTSQSLKVDSEQHEQVNTDDHTQVRQARASKQGQADSELQPQAQQSWSARDYRGWLQEQAYQGNQYQAHSEPQQQYRGQGSLGASGPTLSFNATAPETPTVILQKKDAHQQGGFFNSFVQTLGSWFELDPEFARIPKNRMFRNIGMLLNILAAILIGVLRQPPSGWFIFGGLLYSLVLFNLCIRLVNPRLAIAAGLLVAVYWGYVSFVLWYGLYLYGPYVPGISPFLITLLPPTLSALFFFAASAYLHIRYVMNRLP